MKIKWNKLAVNQFFDIIKYLEQNNAIDYAEKLEKEIFSKIRTIPEKPTIHQLDRLKRLNDGSFFAFEIDSYRISYRKLNKEIRILRIRHSSRRPFTR